MTNAAYDKIWFYMSVALLNVGAVVALGWAYALPALQPRTVLAATPPPAARQQEPIVTSNKPKVKSGTPVRVVIPARGIDLSVKNGTYDAASGTWTLNDTGAFYATPTTPVNSGGGTTLIYGHNTPAIFNNLHQLKPNEELSVYTDNGFIFRYRFDNSQEVNPDNVSMFRNDGPPTVILQTCSGVWSEYRKLFAFRLVSVEKP